MKLSELLNFCANLSDKTLQENPEVLIATPEKDALYTTQGIVLNEPDEQETSVVIEL